MNVWTRAVEMKDSDFLLKLKNDPSTRRFAIVTHEKIKKADHEKWLARTLERKDVLYFLIMTGDKPCGTVRFDLSGGEAEVAIHIAKRYRGHGIATSIIDSVGKAVAYHHKCRLTAKIVDSNMRSMVVFLKNGFYLREHRDGVSYLEQRDDD